LPGAVTTVPPDAVKPCALLLALQDAHSAAQDVIYLDLYVGGLGKRVLHGRSPVEGIRVVRMEF